MANPILLHRRAARILPEVIKTSGIVLDDDGQRQLASMLFSMRRRSSGSMAFRISGRTIAAMGDDPLSYLRKARWARAGLEGCIDPVGYRPWHSASLPVREPTVGTAASMPVFFSSKDDGKGWVIVVPAERLAIYAWCDGGTCRG